MTGAVSRPARIQDVAAAAGVSVATVSNVLNRPERVRPETSAKVLSAVRELDYVAHPGASGLRRGRGSSLGLVVPDIVNSFYARIATGAADAAYEHGYSLTLCHSGDDPDRERAYFDLLADQRAAGVVVVPLTADRGRLTRLRQRGIPLVMTDRAGSVADGCSVAVDDVLGGRLAVGQLVASGAGSVLVVNGSGDIRQCADRYQGARLAAREHPGVRLNQVVVAEMTVAAGVDAAHALTEVPAGVFCTNDFLAVGLVRGLLERGIQVPTDVRVVGFGDLDVATFASLPLTTVRQSVEELGRAAVELLLDEVETPAGHSHESRVFAPTLVVRASSPLAQVSGTTGR